MTSASVAASPYKGLVPYAEGDAAFFFGRDSERDVVIANLKAHRIVVLYGPSGVGKSSLLRAGVDARLRETARENRMRLGTLEFLPVVFNSWRVDPVAGLTEGIRSVVSELTGEPFDVSGDLAGVIERAGAHADASLLVMLDQFEEYSLAHLLGTADKRFAHELPDVVNRLDLPVRFLISLRDDALASLDGFARRIPTLWNARIRIEPLTRAAAREAIEKPIARYNERQGGDEQPVTIEPGLTEAILDDLQAEPGLIHSHQPPTRAGADEAWPGSDAIEAPYLQVVMTRLWEVEARDGSHQLQADTFSQLGGAARIFQMHLERALEALSSNQREAAAAVFQYLVTPSGMKIAQNVETLASWSGQRAADIQVLFDSLQADDSRIVRGVPPPPGRDDVPRYEILHDVLGPAILDWVSRESKARLASPVGEEGAAGFGGGARETLEPGIALCLSGGGYRAMLFHVGALWRLNELGFLPRLDRVSSVSGGSITAATLGLQWARLAFDAGGVAGEFVAELVAPLRKLASTAIDGAAVVGGILRPGRSAADMVIQAYRKHLFGDATLQHLPDHPRFLFTATNLQTGSLWRFSKPFMADHLIGVYPAPQVELAVAVGASAAAPPVLSPVRLALDANGYAPDARGELCRPPFNTDPALTDGSIADNLALETAWKRYATILVSDAGGRTPPEGDVRSDWARQALRVTSLIDSHLRNLRKRQTIEAFKDGTRKGAYWGVYSDIAAYGLDTALPAPLAATTTLAETPNRLARLPDDLQERLINWGYAVCDAAIRAHVERGAPSPHGFPYPASGVG